MSFFLLVVEGVTLKQLNISAYSSDTFHESPIFLQFYQLLLSQLNEFHIFILFIFVDLTTAFLLANVCFQQLKYIHLIEKKRINVDLSKKNNELFKELLVSFNSFDQLSFWCTAIYILSPYSMLSCVGQSTSVFINFLISSTLFFATNGRRYVSLLLLALLTLNSFYSLILFLPVIMILEQKFQIERSSKEKNNLILINFRSTSTQISFFFSTLIFILFSIFLFTICLYLENWSFQFVHSVYVFM